MNHRLSDAPADADRNWRRFILFRVLFYARFYYAVIAILFLDLGITPVEYTLLNFAWAVTIVLVDVPAGVIADRIGRKPLLVAATVCMVAEMSLLILAPRNGGGALFLFCLANRILSGAAEGMANGADEALVFDSLAERGRSAEWPRVLDQVTRWESLGFALAMPIGAAIYDPSLVNRLGSLVGIHLGLTQANTVRFPIYLNLLTALLAFAVAWGFREPVQSKPRAVNPDTSKEKTAVTAWGHLLEAGRWILQTPVALFVVVSGLLLDSVVRLFLTFASSYLRIIELPEASFGLVGSVIAGMGLVAAPIANRLVRTRSLQTNYALVALLALSALAGAAFQWPLWGVLIALPLGAAAAANGFFVSYYLNALVEPSQRATVLSFKGLAFNLAYGFVGLLFALGLRTSRDAPPGDHALRQGLSLLPLWLLATLGVLLLTFYRRRKAIVFAPVPVALPAA